MSPRAERAITANEQTAANPHSGGGRPYFSIDDVGTTQCVHIYTGAYIALEQIKIRIGREEDEEEEEEERSSTALYIVG